MWVALLAAVKSCGCCCLLSGPSGEQGGSDWIAAQKAGCDVLSFSWLERCYAEGTRVHPWPSEYLQISDATLQVC